MKYILLCLSLPLMLLIGRAEAQYCTNDTRYAEVAFFDSTGITILNNLKNGIAPDFQSNPDTLLLNLHCPKFTTDPSPLGPFVMLKHGGGFSSGDKPLGEIRDLCIHLAMRGFACVSMHYRMGDTFSEYAQFKARYRAFQDGHAAFRYIADQPATARIDTNWLFVDGQSAGSLCAPRARCFFKSAFCSNRLSFYTDDSIAPNCSVPLSNVQNSALKPSVSVHPNPFESQYKVSGVGGPATLTLMNTMGQIIGTGMHLEEMPTMGLLPGIYFLRIAELETGHMAMPKLIKI